jgi:carbohydrate-selective porin OprB
MKPKTAKQLNVLKRFTFGLLLAVCISGFCAQAIAADEPAQAADAAKAGETAKKEKGKLSLTKVAPDVTPVSDYSGDIWNRSTLTGDWWGSRTNLYEHGVMVDAALTQIFQGVASGGSDSGDTMYNGLLDYGLSLDTGKLDLWSGGLFVFNAQTGFASGDPLEAGNISPPNFTSIYPTGDFDDTQLMEYYWNQALSKDALIWVGRINAVNFLDTNRFANDPRNQFMNLSMSNNPLMGGVVSFSTLAVLAHFQITDNFAINPAFYDSSMQPGNYRNDLFDDPGYAVQADLTWKLDDDLHGALHLQGLYADKDVTKLDNPRLLPQLETGVSPETRSGNWVIGLNVEQYLWKPPPPAVYGERPRHAALARQRLDRKESTVRTKSFDFQEPGIGLFGRFGYSPENRNAWNIYASGGIGGRGIIPGRIYDRLGLGVYWLKESSDLNNQPADLLDDELGFEAFYNLALTPWAQLSFDVQWIDSGVTETDDTVVLGTRLFTAF